MGTNTVNNSIWTDYLIRFFAGNLELTITIIIGIFLVLGLLMVIYLRDLNFKKKINILKQAHTVHGFKIEQLEMKIRKEERERIAQNLHDDLAGTLAAVKNSINIVFLENDTNNNHDRLRAASLLAEKAYNDVRYASHNLFDSALLSEEELFSQHIQQLGSMVFPSNKYAFNVSIDDDALQNISMEKRFELIRVLKEAFVNIIKHSQASQVDLLVYQDCDNLHISLKDNGIGFKKNVQKSSLGIRSMKRRIKKINGFLNINNNKTGVELEILISY